MFRNRKSGATSNKGNTETEMSSSSPQLAAISTADDTKTVTKDNTSTGTASKVSMQELKTKLADTAISLAGMQSQLQEERAGKRKLYTSLVKLASELKRMRNESQPLQDAMDYANRSWYEGGMWRSPAILPGVKSQQVKTVLREATGLSNLFFNLVIVTAFTRVGRSVAETGNLSVDSLLYFAVFWMIWTKDISYTTRFDSTDLSFEVVNLISCIAVLLGSLSTNASMATKTGKNIMMMAGVISTLHMLLHLRVAIYHRNESDGTIESLAFKHATFSIAMTVCETATWTTGFFLSDLIHHRWIIFVVGIFFSVVRLPKHFLESDFHAASSKRGVLFILLIGFLLQSVVGVASPFFEYETLSIADYGYFGGCCLMLYCIKLLYSDDAPKLAQDHALLVNAGSAFFFNIGQFCLVLSTTVLGAGLDVTTHSYLAATSALPENSKEMLCGGFGAVVFSIFFIKSMHMKRIPVDGYSRGLFVGAYVTQALVTLAVVGISVSIYLGQPVFSVVTQDEITLMLSLSAVTFFLVFLNWLDEAVELALYDTGDDSSQALVHPFGLWWCLSPSAGDLINEKDEIMVGPGALSSMSPLLGASVVNMQMPGYDALGEV